MKKIHITESQVKELKKKLAEEEKDEITVDAHPNSSGQITTQDLSQQYQAAKKNVTGARVALKVDGSDLTESKDSVHFTKRQIKEAKIKKLQENSVVFRKKDLR